MHSDLGWALFAGVVGLGVATLLTTVIRRVPAAAEVGGPRRECHASLDVRDPLVEAVTGILFAAVTWRMLRLDIPAAVPAYLYLAAIGIALTVIDIDHRRLPNKIVLPSYPVLAVLLTFASSVSGDWAALGRGGLGAAALLAFYLVIALAHPAGMGFGDVKLSGVLGAALAYLSWSTLAIGAFGAFLLGALGGIAVMATGRGTRKTAIPFGPFMIASALIAIFAAQPVADAYLDLMGR